MQLNMSELLSHLQSVSEQAQKGRVLRDEEKWKSLRASEEARVAGRINQIHNLALEQAKAGGTSLLVSKLDPKRYFKFWGRKRDEVEPSALYQDDRLIAEVLKREGFKLYIGWVTPGNEGGDPPPGSVYNYFGISWNKADQK